MSGQAGNQRLLIKALLASEGIKNGNPLGEVKICSRLSWTWCGWVALCHVHARFDQNRSLREQPLLEQMLSVVPKVAPCQGMITLAHEA